MLEKFAYFLKKSQKVSTAVFTQKVIILKILQKSPNIFATFVRTFDA